MKLKILFAGIDGTGKTTCLDALVSVIDPTHCVMRVGSSGYFLTHRGVRRELVSRELQDQIDRIGQRARRWRIYGFFLIVNFLFKFLSSKYFQAVRDADVVMFETDTLLHPAVVITYHFPFMRRVSAKVRFRAVRLMFGGRRNTTIVYFEANPATSVERILRREAETGMPVEPHENLEDLTALKEEFEKVVEAAIAAGYDVVWVDTNDHSAEEVARIVEQALRDRLPPPRAATATLADAT